MESALRDSEARHRTLIEDASDPIATFSLKTGTILTVNHALELILGYTREELVGQHARKIGTPRAIADATEHARRAIADGTLPPVMEQELIHKDGRILPVEARAALIRDARGRLVEAQLIYR